MHDPVPKDEVELRRASSVRSSDGHELGEVPNPHLPPGTSRTECLTETEAR
jgi:hypothetical protein